MSFVHKTDANATTTNTEMNKEDAQAFKNDVHEQKQPFQGTIYRKSFLDEAKQPEQENRRLTRTKAKSDEENRRLTRTKAKTATGSSLEDHVENKEVEPTPPSAAPASTMHHDQISSNAETYFSVIGFCSTYRRLDRYFGCCKARDCV